MASKEQLLTRFRAAESSRQSDTSRTVARSRRRHPDKMASNSLVVCLSRRHSIKNKPRLLLLQKTRKKAKLLQPLLVHQRCLQWPRTTPSEDRRCKLAPLRALSLLQRLEMRPFSSQHQAVPSVDRKSQKLQRRSPRRLRSQSQSRSLSSGLHQLRMVMPSQPHLSSELPQLEISQQAPCLELPRPEVSLATSARSQPSQMISPKERRKEVSSATRLCPAPALVVVSLAPPSQLRVAGFSAVEPLLQAVSSVQHQLAPVAVVSSLMLLAVVACLPPSH